MRTNNIKITGYFSHPIRGLKGAQATREDMNLNNDLAALVGRMLHNFCPNLDLYIPAVHDEYVTEAYLRGGVETDKEILEIDKIILRRRDIFIAFAYKGVFSKGMRIEIDEAHERKIPVFIFKTVTEIPRLVEQIVNWYYESKLS